MKGDRLGEFEELTLLAVRALAEQAYAVSVHAFVERGADRDVSMGAVYAALDRLERKGYVESEFGAASPIRGGKRKRLYELTPLGAKTLKELRRVRDVMWRAVKDLS